MPFTFAHPALVLPLINKRWTKFSSTGLIAGSMAPDFETFIKFGEHKIYSHTYPGIFWFDLPLGLAIAFVFQLIVKDPLIDHLPHALREKFTELSAFQWLGYFKKHYIIVLYSLLLGIFTHFVWDAFTHLNLFEPDSITSHIVFCGHRVYILLQYSCSLLGLFVIGWYIFRMPRIYVPQNHSGKLLFWVSILLIASAIATYLFAHANVVWKWEKIYFINAGISSFFTGLIFVCCIQKCVKRHKRTVTK